MVWYSPLSWNMAWYNPLNLLKLTPSKKKQLMLEEILQFVKVIVNHTEVYQMGRDRPDYMLDNEALKRDFLKHSKNKCLDLALAVRKKFEEYNNYRYTRGEINPQYGMGGKALRYGGDPWISKTNRVIDSLVLALEDDKLNEQWRIARQIERKIEVELQRS